MAPKPAPRRWEKRASGKGNRSKNMALLMAMHKIPYSATATMSHLEDLAKKLLKARELKNEGFCYLHVFCPCPTGWGVAADMSIELCRMAVKTNYFPLWEAYKGNFCLTHEVKKAQTDDGLYQDDRKIRSFFRKGPGYAAKGCRLQLRSSVAYNRP